MERKTLWKAITEDYDKKKLNRFWLALKSSLNFMLQSMEDQKISGEPMGADSFPNSLTDNKRARA